MLNVKHYTESGKVKAEKNYVFFASVGAVLRSNKTGKLWTVNGIGFGVVMISRKQGKLYAPKLNVTCEDGTVTQMFDELMQGNFEVVDLNRTQCDRVIFKALRNLAKVNAGAIGELFSLAANCYRLPKSQGNLFTRFLSQKESGKFFFDSTFELNHENRTICIFGRPTALFQFKGAKA